ncbi:hypothetical protein CC1G_04283 [Coprinopsis cinerea okayama7|uniref:Nucleolus and neural progenitor protein-like N-terminal domain-containing protein n=1 Tax=Coprinopsis cinerea (strain Okayama-7 / 130 / ATCC MYA-4618 / FGSC 9003) TaxID=240176 RepID=A8NFK0_COPC7|nr:hypothetical protein CC1G_04283 [Coprinopsis cinerea okayama7\|eukprot:XP_001833304.2 hypothetical protein CC1G_04283 [Coprinopsis cinerea okayama7\
MTTLCQSFFGGTSETDPPLFKGSWNHYPDEASFQRVLDSLNILKRLFLKLSSRGTDAYQHFSLSMQSGAFLQLILTLTAITSRFCCLAQELVNITDDLLLHTNRLRIAIFVTKVLPSSLVIPEEKVNAMVTMVDIQEEHDPSKGSEGSDVSSQPGAPVMHPVVTVALPLPEASEQPPNREAVPGLQGPKPTRSSKTDVAKPGRTKPKKKSKRDEIDDIFGF